MDFELREEERMIKEAARNFALSKFPNLKAGLREGEFPLSLWREACQAKLVGPRIPEQYGGAGTSMLTSLLIQEEFCRVNPRLGEALSSATLGSDLLVRHGSEEQGKKYLRPLVEGRARMGVVGVEKKERVLRVEGKKGKMEVRGEVELPPGPVPEYLVVKGLVEGQPSLLVLELGAKRPEGGLLQLRMEVGEENLVGEKGKEPEMTVEFLAFSGMDRGAQALGIAEGALERALEYLSKREEVEKPAWDYSHSLRKLAEVKTELEASRWLVYRAAWLADRGKVDPVLAVMAEWKAGRTAVLAAEEAALLHEGTWGHLEDYGIERFRDFSLLYPRFSPSSAQRLTPSLFLSEGLERVEEKLRRDGSPRGL